MNWSIEFCGKPVEDELSALPTDMLTRLLRISDLLREVGPPKVGMPYVRPLESKLWEMRLKGRSGIGRAIYSALPGRRLVILHVFIKKTQKTPRSAIHLALTRLKEM